MENRIIEGECLQVLESLDCEKSVSLIYIDPPFCTQKTQKLGNHSYDDKFDSLESYLDFLHKRIVRAKELLAENGSFFVHIDYRTVHYVKVMMDKIFGVQNFMNEIVWAYDYGGRAKKYWSRKHDNILWYVNNPKDYIFNFDEMDRIPYMAPGLVGPEKAARGKTPTDVFWHTIVPTNGKERVGYPTQKPLGLIERFVKVHSNPGDLVMDFFSGSGTTLVAAKKHGRKYLGIEKNPEAITIIEKRLEEIS
jgi:site-specific DNA-methyltransferase (adenine-specific)